MTPRSVLRWWWWIGALAVAAFAAYVSFVPFNFVHPRDGFSMGALWDRMNDNRSLSRGNLAANAVMFVPFGFFFAAALGWDSPRLRAAIATTGIVLPVSVILSVFIESLQMFLPDRTPSLADIEAQTIGSLAGIAAWFLLGREVRTLSSGFASGSRRALEALLAGYAAIRFLLLLLPLDVTVGLSQIARKFRTGGVILNPLASPSFRWEMLPSLLSDVVLAVPIGVLATLAGVPAGSRRRAMTAIALAGSFFVAAELAHLFVRSRSVDAFHLVVHCIGAAVGIAVTALSMPRAAGRAASAPWSRHVLTLAILLAAAIYAAYNLSPFDFTFSRAQVAGRAGALANVPFHAYYINREFKALADALIKLSLAAPLGVFFQLRVRPNAGAYPRSVTAIWLGVTAAFFAAVEIGQVFLPTRYPDNTDVLLALAAVWIGMRVARPFGSDAGGSR